MLLQKNNLSQLTESKLSNSGSNEQFDSPETDSSVSSSESSKASSDNDVNLTKILKLLTERIQNKYKINADNSENDDKVSDSKPSKSSSNEQFDSSETDSSVSSSESSGTHPNKDVSFRLLKLLVEIIQNNDNTNADEDGDKYFLLSLLNSFKKIPEYRKIDAKCEIIEIIKKYTESTSYAHEQHRYNTDQTSRDQVPPTELQKQSPVSEISTNSDCTLYDL